MTQPPVDPVPSIPEAEATGATKSIYADFKAVTGVPVVNLIFRHIARYRDAWSGPGTCCDPYTQAAPWRRTPPN